MPKISEYMKKSAGNEEQIKIARILAGDTITAESAVIYRRAIETAAENFSDDIALEYPNLYPEWNNIIGQTVEVGKGYGTVENCINVSRNMRRKQIGSLTFLRPSGQRY